MQLSSRWLMIPTALTIVLALTLLITTACSGSRSEHAELITKVLAQHHQITSSGQSAADGSPELVIKAYPELLTIGLEGAPKDFATAFDTYRSAMEKAFHAAVEVRNNKIFERNQMAAPGSSDRSVNEFKSTAREAATAFEEVLKVARKHGAAMPQQGSAGTTDDRERSAASAPVLGSWKTGASGGLFNSESVELIYRFRKNGTFERHITRRDWNGPQTAEQEGTWKMEGEIMTVTIRGDASKLKLVGETAASLTWIGEDGISQTWTRIGDAR